MADTKKDTEEKKDPATEALAASARAEFVGAGLQFESPPGRELSEDVAPLGPQFVKKEVDPADAAAKRSARDKRIGSIKEFAISTLTGGVPGSSEAIAGFAKEERVPKSLLGKEFGAAEQEQARAFRGEVPGEFIGPPEPENIPSAPATPREDVKDVKKGKEARIVEAELIGPPEPLTSAAEADISGTMKEQENAAPSPLRQRIEALMQVMTEQSKDPAMKPRPFTRGQSIAAAILAGIDKESYALLVQPEIDRRQQEVTDAGARDDKERARQIDAARVAVEMESLLDALDQEEEAEAKQKLGEEFLFNAIRNSGTRTAKTAREFAKSDVSESIRRQLTNSADYLDSLAPGFTQEGFTAETFGFYGDEVARLDAMNLAMLAAEEARRAGKPLSQKDRDTLNETTLIIADIDRAMSLVMDDSFGSSQLSGSKAGGAWAWFADKFGYSEQMADRDKLHNILSRLTGQLNRSMGGGAALSELEAELLDGIFMTLGLTKTQKIARLGELKRFMVLKRNLIVGAGEINPNTGRRAGVISTRESSESLLKAFMGEEAFENSFQGTNADGSRAYKLPNGKIVVIEDVTMGADAADPNSSIFRSN